MNGEDMLAGHRLTLGKLHFHLHVEACSYEQIRQDKFPLSLFGNIGFFVRCRFPRRQRV